MSVLIMMTTYNGETYLRAQLDSLLAQDNGDFTLAVQDDGSTDATNAILEEYRAYKPSPVHKQFRRHGVFY
jgi:rhamnosyltransferase